LGKLAILATSTLTSNKKMIKNIPMSEAEHKGDKLSSDKIQNKLVKNNKSLLLLLRLIKLGSEFSNTRLVILYANLPGTRHPLLDNATATFLPYENHDVILSNQKFSFFPPCFN
jgi:hypothetical protein